MLTDPLLHEVLDQWPAWQTLVSHIALPTENARDIDPHEIARTLADDMTSDRRARLMFLFVGHGHADSLHEAAGLLGELRRLAVAGKRPRFAVEAGLTFDEFEGARP